MTSGLSGHGLALRGRAGRLVAKVMVVDDSRFDTVARLKHRRFPGHWRRTRALVLRTAAPVLGMAWYRLKDTLT